MIYIVRYGEMSTKGTARTRFEKAFVRSIKSSLKGRIFWVQRKKGRIFVDCEDDIKDELSHIFGITSFSQSQSFDINSIDDVKERLNLNFKGTFAVRVKRVNFPGSSLDMEREIGSYIVGKTGAKVNLTKPDKEFNIEIRGKTAFIFDETIRGAGGLPVGTGGRVLASLKTKRDIVAAWLLMKRGCALVTDDESVLSKWHNGSKIMSVADGLKWCHAKVSSSEFGEKSDLLALDPLVGMSEKEVDDLFASI